ncbi:MAG TPA: putative collagen-binding domain-containing protein, partial [Gemmatimonadales bacterium]|nr:putative collagen-binding domain-containing protein [Gemmatimonadales bacterium]
GGYFTDPPAADGRKVIILDTDHLGTESTRASWVWKAFLRGMNPIFMDSYDGKATGLGARPDFDPTRDQYVQVRRAMGYTLTYATRLPLNTMIPAGDRSSTGYCLADTGAPAYLVYLPEGGTVTVTLAAAPQRLTPEWFSPGRNRLETEPVVTASGHVTLQAPFPGDAVLYLH